jgi:hypothetical protein
MNENLWKTTALYCKSPQQPGKGYRLVAENRDQALYGC